MDTINSSPGPAPQPTGSNGAMLSRLTRFGTVHCLEEVTSTNDYARKLAAEGKPAIVMADIQTRGRGRFDREWDSQKGGLWFSLLLYPELPSERLGLLTLSAGLAVARAVEEKAGLKPEILWPNDVYVGEKKVCGVLCEAKGPAVIAGIGINLNQPSFPFGLPDATSLHLLTGKNYDRFEMMVAVCEEFGRRLDDLKAGKTLPLIGEVKARMAMLGRPVTVETSWLPLVPFARRHVPGTAVDLNENGELLVQTQDGATRTFSAGKVTRVR